MSIMIPFIILSFYGIGIIASIVLIIWAIRNRSKEKKREKEEFKDYDKY